MAIINFDLLIVAWRPFLQTSPVSKDGRMLTFNSEWSSCVIQDWNHNGGTFWIFTWTNNTCKVRVLVKAACWPQIFHTKLSANLPIFILLKHLYSCGSTYRHYPHTDSSDSVFTQSLYYFNFFSNNFSTINLFFYRSKTFIFKPMQYYQAPLNVPTDLIFCFLILWFSLLLPQSFLRWLANCLTWLLNRSLQTGWKTIPFLPLPSPTLAREANSILFKERRGGCKVAKYQCK